MPRRGAYLHVNLCTKFEMPPHIFGFAYHHEDARRCKRILALVQTALDPSIEVRSILARDLGDYVLRIDGHLKDVESCHKTIADEVIETNQLAKVYASELETEDAERRRPYKRGAYIYLDVGQGMRIPYDPYGFIFYHESERVVHEIAYAAGDWYYQRGAICKVLTGKEVGLQYLEADEWVDLHQTLGCSDSMQACAKYAQAMLEAMELRTKRSRKAARAEEKPGSSVPKLDGWTKQELISQAGTEWEGFSASTFDRLRKDANVDGGKKGGSGAHHRYAPRELKLLIEAAERRGRTSGNREYAALAKAWRQLIPQESSAQKA